MERFQARRPGALCSNGKGGGTGKHRRQKAHPVVARMAKRSWPLGPLGHPRHGDLRDQVALFAHRVGLDAGKALGEAGHLGGLFGCLRALLALQLQPLIGRQLVDVEAGDLHAARVDQPR